MKHFPLANFDRVIRINLVGTFRCIAKSAAGMLSLEPLADGERGAIGGEPRKCARHWLPRCRFRGGSASSTSMRARPS